MNNPYSIPATAGAAAAAQVLQDTGLVIINDALDTALHSELLADLRSLLEQADPNDPAIAAIGDAAADRIGITEDVLMPGQTRRLMGLVGKSPAYGKLITSPLLAEIRTIVLGPYCDGTQLHGTAAMSVGPGAKTQSLHREEDSFPPFFQPRPPLVIACMAALTDFTRDNGATRMVPGSHRWEDGRNATADEIIPAEMPAGSLLVWMGRTLHGAGANITRDEWRTGVFISYSLGWLRQEENQYLATPAEVAARLPEAVRTLAGFGMYSSSLGLYEGNMGH
ncbi:MAG: phytanoyl-CoA dioxygenase family protein [Porticoccaceae bacterium]